MNEIKIFDNPQFGNLRTVSIDGEPWFVGKDVATILGYTNSRDALAKRVDPEDKGVAKCDTLGGTQDITVINESGLYSLILSSKLPSARQFKHWVTSDVLPSIRQTGAYLTPNLAQQILSDPDALFLVLDQLRQERSDRLKAQHALHQANDELATLKTQLNSRPRTVFAFADDPEATSCCSIADLAAQIAANRKIPISRVTLFRALRIHGYIRPDTPLPTTKALEAGLLVILEKRHRSSRYYTTGVTLAGQLFFTVLLS